MMPRRILQPQAQRLLTLADTYGVDIELVQCLVGIGRRVRATDDDARIGTGRPRQRHLSPGHVVADRHDAERDHVGVPPVGTAAVERSDVIDQRCLVTARLQVAAQRRDRAVEAH